MKFSGNFKNKDFLNKIKSLKQLDGASVEIGWFDEQHPTANMTFAELAHYHATGGGGRVIPRNVLQKTLAIYPFDKDKEATKALAKFLNDPKNPDALLSAIGRDYVDKIKGLFGTSHLSPTPNNPDPLIDTGALRDNTSYKIKR